MSSTDSGPLKSLNPLVLYLTQKVLIIVLLGFTPPNSLLRYAPLPILLFISISILPYYNLHFPDSGGILWAAGEILVGHLEFLEKVLLSQWSFEKQGLRIEGRRAQQSSNGAARGPSSRSEKANGFTNGNINGTISHKNTENKEQSPGNVYRRLEFAFWAGTSNRYIDTPYQTLHTPAYSASSPSYIPSRITFLLRKAMIAFACVIILDLISLSRLIPRDLSLFTEQNTNPFLSPDQVNMQWMMTRMRGTVGLWMGNFVGIQMYYSMLTSIGVALGITSPSERRPVFGSITDAYTIRGYWGQFWHQLFRKKLTKPARYLTFNVLRLPRPSTLQPHLLRLFTRRVQLFLTYLISGLFHQFMDRALGIPFSDAGAIKFFLMLAVGITVEDVGQWIYERAPPSLKGSSQMWKLLGYVWTFLFLSWTTPLWLYPRLRLEQRGDLQDSGLVSGLGRYLRPSEETVIA